MGFLSASAHKTMAGAAARQVRFVREEYVSPEILREKRLLAEERDRLLDLSIVEARRQRRKLFEIEQAAKREAAREGKIQRMLRASEELGHNPDGKGSPRDLIRHIAKLHGVEMQDVLGLSQKSKILNARHHAIYAMKQTFTAYSITRIGHVFNRDHKSISSALRGWPAKAAKLGMTCTPLEPSA